MGEERESGDRIDLLGCITSVGLTKLNHIITLQTSMYSNIEVYLLKVSADGVHPSPRWVAHDAPPSPLVGLKGRGVDALMSLSAATRGQLLGFL